MCDFKPGDEVVCIAVPDGVENLGFWRQLFYRSPVSVGRVYTVSDISRRGDLVLIRLKGVRNATPSHWFAAHWFRKVQRRDMSQWLETATDFEEPKRAPAKTPEPAQ